MKPPFEGGFILAGVTGLEPATSSVTGKRSNQLSYTPNNSSKSYHKFQKNKSRRRIIPPPAMIIYLSNDSF